MATKKKVDETDLVAAETQTAEDILAAARAEAERIIAQAKADAEKLAEPAPAPAPAPRKRKRGEEFVMYTAPLAPGNERQDIFVGVNGESIRIMRGQPVRIKRKFVKVLEAAARQEMAAFMQRQEAKKAASRSSGDF